jgi:hypothetical protein
VAAFATTRQLIDQGQFDVGGLMLRHAMVVAADNRAGDVVAAMETAAEPAARFGKTGEDNPLGFAFGPDRPRPPFKTRQSAYWMDYGRALARVPRRGDGAVMALRKAERLFPIHAQRNPLVCEVLAALLARSPGTRSAGNSVAWPTGLACQCGPFGVVSMQADARYGRSFMVVNRDRRTRDAADRQNRRTIPQHVPDT